MVVKNSVKKVTSLKKAKNRGDKFVNKEKKCLEGENFDWAAKSRVLDH